MKRKRFTEERIGRMARIAETIIVAATRQHRVFNQSFYRWQRQFGQMDGDDVLKLRHLQQKNTRLKKIIVERDLKGK